MINLRILHVSDLHASSTKEWNQRLIVDEMLRDVHQYQQKRAFDLVVFTGDLANAGKAEDFALGRTLLVDPLLKQLKLSRDRIVLVPGNHDIDLAAVEEYSEEGLEKKLVDREAVNRLLLGGNTGAALQRIAPWRSFSDDFYVGIDREFHTPLGWTQRISIDGISVGIAVLNSAWRSSAKGEAERGRLLIGEPQLHPALKAIKDTDIRLVLFHHPLSWLHPFDHDDSRVQLERFGAVVLTGHEHEADPTMDLTPRGSAVYGRAGCLYQSRLYRNSFSIIDVDASAKAATFNIREWIDPRQAFDAGVTTAASGSVTVPLPRTLGGSGGPLVPFTRVTQGLLELAQKSAIVGELAHGHAPTAVADWVVPPRLYPVPYPEVEAARVAAPHGNTIAMVDPLAALAESRVVIVSGEPSAGVTDALLWLIERKFGSAGNFLPLYVRFDPRQGKHVIQDDLRDAALHIGVELTGDSVPTAVVAIDDVTVDSPRPLERLCKYITEHPDNLYVLGTHGQERRISEALSRAGISARRLYLGPFGRREMKQIASKLAGVQSGELPDQVLHVLADKGLPRTPFLMVTLMAVLLQNPEAVVLNASAVIDAHVSLLLGQLELPILETMDFRARQYLLEFLAGEMTKAGVLRLERQKIERMVLTYFEDRVIRGVSAGRVIDDLIARRILMEEGGSVGFRHPTLHYLFAAKLMAEDRDFAARIQEKPLDYSEIIQHAAALSRADRDLLAVVADFCRPVIEEQMRSVSESSVEVLLQKGEASPIDVRNLDEIVSRTAPPPEDVLDALLDELWDRARNGSGPEARTVESLNQQQKLSACTSLISDVLVSSELVKDVPLRVDVLKDAVRGWSAVAVSVLQAEEESGQFRQFLEKTLFPKGITEEQRSLVDRVVRAIMFLSVGLMAAGALGKRQTQGLIADVVRDEQFMGGAINAFITTLAAVLIRAPGWPDLLVSLYATHGSHAFIAEVVHSMAMNRFQATTTTDAEAAILKPFLVDNIMERSGRGNARPDERQRLRSEIGSKLQKGRLQVKLRGLPDDLLAVPDPGDSAADQDVEDLRANRQAS